MLIEGILKTANALNIKSSLMNWCIYVLSILVTVLQLLSCHESKENIIIRKNSCYNQKLYKLRNDSEYQNVLHQFSDSFQHLKSREQVFHFTENKIDEAVLFSKDKNKCILLVLQRFPDGNRNFGYGRAIIGVRKKDFWHFELNREYIFGKDLFALYKDNNFENISKLARNAILIDGNPSQLDCNIDETFWFDFLRAN